MINYLYDMQRNIDKAIVFKLKVYNILAARL